MILKCVVTNDKIEKQNSIDGKSKTKLIENERETLKRRESNTEKRRKK